MSREARTEASALEGMLGVRLWILQVHKSPCFHLRSVKRLRPSTNFTQGDLSAASFGTLIPIATMIQSHSKLMKLHPSSNGKPCTTVLLVIAITLSICLVTMWVSQCSVPIGVMQLKAQFRRTKQEEKRIRHSTLGEEHTKSVGIKYLAELSHFTILSYHLYAQGDHLQKNVIQKTLPCLLYASSEPWQLQLWQRREKASSPHDAKMQGMSAKDSKIQGK